LSMFIRYLLTPFLISFYGFEKSAILIPTETSFNIAINLMLYELIIIFLLFQFTYKKIYKPQNTLKQNVEVSGNFWNCIIIIISIIIVFIYPEILSRYAFIFNANELKSKKLEIEIISFLPLIVQLGFLTITMTLVNYFYKKYKTNENKIYVVLVIAIVLVTSSFIIGTSRFSVVLPLVTGLFMTFILFKKHWR